MQTTQIHHRPSTVCVLGCTAVAAAFALVAISHAQEPERAGEAIEAVFPDRLAVLHAAISQSLDHIPGEVLVKFRAGTSAGAQASVMRLAPPPANGPRMRWIGDLALVSVDPNTSPSAVAGRLAIEPEVEYAQPNYLTRLRSTPNDPGLSQQWNFTAIEVPRAWDINPGGSGVVVAVIDSGVTTTTVNVTHRLWTGRGFSNVSVPYRVNPDLDLGRFAGHRDTTSTRLTISGLSPQPVFDTEGHGTHVAGTILQSTDNAIGFAGIAYSARLLSVKSCFSYWDYQLYLSALGQPGFVPADFGGGCATADVVEGIRFAADNGAQVINLSLGGRNMSPAYLDALNYAVQRGSFVAISVGNSYEGGNPLEYPAAYAANVNGAMSVGAVGRSLRRAYYSNTGSHVEITAPGGDVRDGGVSGTIYQNGLFSSDFDPETVILPRFDRYAAVPSQGTSMSAPHVAGVAALLHSQGVTNPAAIEAAIKRFARDLGTPGLDPEHGHGLIDARATLRGLGLAR